MAGVAFTNLADDGRRIDAVFAVIIGQRRFHRLFCEHRAVDLGGALGVGAELITSSGPDSYVGRVAAVMLGSTETTFYTIAVYFGAVGISRTRYAVPAALCADLTGFLAAAWAVRLCFGGG